MGLESGQIVLLLCAGLGMFAVIGGLSLLAHYYTLNGIKSKTVGDGQHGTARFATEKEIKDTYAHVPYEPEKWRRGEALPDVQGLVVGCKKKGSSVTALVDDGDIHCLMIGAAGVGKTANFLYPNIEYACASGMSWLCTDTKGDLFRNYAGIAKDCYGYNISVLDLRNPTRSDGDNILTLVNKYMDEYLAHPDNLAAKAKAENLDEYYELLSAPVVDRVISFWAIDCTESGLDLMPFSAWGDLVPDDGDAVPVLMGGALPFTNMETLQSENYEDGTYYYADVAEDGQVIVVNTVLPRDFLDDGQTLEDYLTGCALDLGEADTWSLQSVEKNEAYSVNMSYPVYILTYTTGRNEDTREWTVFAMDTDRYTYLYGFGVSIDAADDEMKSVYQDIFAGLYLSDGE